MATVLEAIQSGKWQKALFTTYTLSLSFFESILLRALRQVGCQEIWVVTDIQGYKASLTERRSAAIGQDYRVIPVRLPKGVFHPKCFYLSGAQEDALLVGSGNLTFGGFGRNLEVLEVFSSRKSPRVFGDFAAFLKDLETRIADDMQCPDATWIDTFHALATVAAGIGTTKDSSVRLIHSATTAVLDQLATVVKGVDELTVMSPFFDNDAYAIRATTERLHCKSVRIAVPPKATAFNFPFDETKKWKAKTKPAWIKGQDVTRTVHAKWFEFKGPKLNGVLTGSVNATSQALCTTNNIEVSALRLSTKADPWADWTDSHLPKSFVPAVYTGGMQGEVLAHACLSSGRLLQGTILGAEVEAGNWNGSLVKPSGAAKSFNVDIQSNGTFRYISAELSEFSFSSGLQITLEKGDVVARGWVHVEDILRMTRLPKLNVPAFLRIITRENTEEDDIALLEYLAINANKHLPTFAKKIAQVTSSTVDSSKTDEVVTVHIEELAPTESPIQGNHEHRDQLATLSLERVFAELRKRLLGHGSPQRRRAVASDPTEGEDEGDDGRNPSKNKKNSTVNRFQSALSIFDHEMRTIIQSQELVTEDQRGLFVLWFEVVMSMLVCRTTDTEEAHRFLHGWVGNVARHLRAGTEIDSLEQHLISSVAFLGFVAQNQDSLTELHERLETFFDNQVDRDRCLIALLKQAVMPFGMLLENAPEGTLASSLNGILETTTLRQHVLNVIELRKGGKSIDPSLPLFKGEGGAKVLEQLQSVRRPRFKEQFDTHGTCAHCYVSLPGVMAMHLENRRIAWHERCGHFTVRTK